MSDPARGGTWRALAAMEGGRCNDDTKYNYIGDGYGHVKEFNNWEISS